ncbi:11587_t:CDS:2, partial [Paraglomus brasilianum]
IVSTGSFTELRESGGYYRDKTHFITKIEDLEARAILSLRPRRFGKSLFLSTLSSYYDIKNRERFKQLFADLYIGKNPTKLASSFLVLKLNFAGLRINSTFEIFEEDFHESLNRFMSVFMNRYRQELGDYFRPVNENKSALNNFMMLLEAVQLSGRKLYVCIDEYDAGMNEALKNETILQPLIAHHSTSVQSKVEKIESSFKQFYSRLKYACDEGIARVFQTGVTPVVMTEFTSGFNISKDLALREEFWDLYGFKKSEIELLLDNSLGLPSDVKGGIMEWLKEENDEYFFNSDQTEGIFNPARVLYCIEMLMGKKKKLIDNDYQDTSTIIKKLLGFPPDPQTLPSQTTLDLIVNNPLGKSILTEALNRCPLKSRNGIEQ